MDNLANENVETVLDQKLLYKIISVEVVEFGCMLTTSGGPSFVRGYIHNQQRHSGVGPDALLPITN
jgi:hypothetical protein